MPQVFKIGSYVIFIWYAESNPLEPIHVHVSEGVPSEIVAKWKDYFGEVKFYC